MQRIVLIVIVLCILCACTSMDRVQAIESACIEAESTAMGSQWEKCAYILRYVYERTGERGFIALYRVNGELWVTACVSDNYEFGYREEGEYLDRVEFEDIGEEVIGYHKEGEFDIFMAEE